MDRSDDAPEAGENSRGEKESQPVPAFFQSDEEEGAQQANEVPDEPGCGQIEQPGKEDQNDEESREERGEDQAGQDPGYPPGPLANGSVGLERGVGAAVQHEHAEAEGADGERPGTQKREHGPGVLAPSVERDARHDVPQGDSEEERRQEAGADEDRLPEGFPGRVVSPELERHGPEDEREEDEHESQIEAAEDRRIGHRKGGEERPAPGQQPDLVAVPHRPDGPEEGPLLVLGLRQEREEDADAEVEAVEHRVPGEEDADEQEPGVLEESPGFHQTAPFPDAAASPSGPPRTVLRMIRSPATPMRA